MSEGIYKIIALADIHMSNKLPYARPTENGKTDRLEDQIRLWEHVHNKALSIEADAILILGDLFDKSLVDAVTLATTVEAIVSMPCDVWILPGNHDASTITGGRFTVEAFDSMRKDHVHCFQAGETRYVNEWLRFRPVPFCPSEEAMRVISMYQEEMAGPYASGVDVLLLHHSIVGCEHLGWTCDQGLDADLICDGFDFVLAGHFHRHQTFGEPPAVGEPPGMYLGAPMHHDFGDVGRDAKYWCITYTQDGPAIAMPVDPGLPKFFKVELDHELKSVEGKGLSDYSVRHGDYWRYEIASTPEKWVEVKPKIQEAVKSLEKEGVHASFKHIPIKTHGVRLLGTPRHGVASVSMEGFVRKYVEVAWDEKHHPEGGIVALGVGLNILQEAKDAS